MARAIKASNLELPSGADDGRIDSAEAAKAIVKFLKKEKSWAIQLPKGKKKNSRNWYDFSVSGHYCAIKVSELTGKHDNTNSKKAIYYFLTGKMNSPNPRQKHFQELSNNLQEDKKRDFYYLVVKKPNAGDAFIVSLKGITGIKAAHNNPPFQCDWKQCRKPVKRTWSEARNIFLAKWAESIAKGFEHQLGGMPTYFPKSFAPYAKPLKKQISGLGRAKKKKHLPLKNRFKNRAV